MPPFLAPRLSDHILPRTPEVQGPQPSGPLLAVVSVLSLRPPSHPLAAQHEPVMLRDAAGLSRWGMHSLDTA
jgi:hypothetical protein